MMKVVLKVVSLEMMTVVMTVEQMVDPMEKLAHLKAAMMVEWMVATSVVRMESWWVCLLDYTLAQTMESQREAK